MKKPFKTPKQLSTDVTKSLELTVPSIHHDQRIDKVLASIYTDISRATFQKCIESGSVFINGDTALKRSKVFTDDHVLCQLAAPAKIDLTPQDIPLDILYEDEYFIAINKPAGLVVHPAPGHFDHTVVNALLFYCKDLCFEEDSARPGIVHRLDKDTSGVLVTAKTEQAQARLSDLFAKRLIDKEYIAICTGLPRAFSSYEPISRHPKRRQEMTVSSDRGKPAESHFKLLGQNAFLSCIKATPKTGRTHQIRVHLKHLGAPILGDTLYSNASHLAKKFAATRQCLHAYCLSFIHPFTEKHISLTAPIPEDMMQIIEKNHLKNTSMLA